MAAIDRWDEDRLHSRHVNVGTMAVLGFILFAVLAWWAMMMWTGGGSAS